MRFVPGAVAGRRFLRTSPAWPRAFPLQLSARM
jgi:hypothetical protein